MSLIDASGLSAILDVAVDRFAARRAGRAPQPSWDSVDAWWGVFRADRRDWALPIDQAIFGGVTADRVGYAFAAGYQAALQRLDPSLPMDVLACLSVTEEGGGHPQAIRTTLTPAGDGTWLLRGSKKWATLSAHGSVALVAASVGGDDQGRNRLRLARVDLAAPGVQVEPMPETDFVPEITHGRLHFDGVRVAAGDVLAGDGYTEYVKPFRTIEDIYVGAAVMTYLAGIALRYDWPREYVGDVLHLLVAARAMGFTDPRSAAVHVALEGWLVARQKLMERATPFWDLVDVAERMRWQRDRPLTTVAERVRGLRTESAWRRITEPSSAD